MSIDTDVLVVGAGPTGLLLAGDLARAGVRVTVLDKRAEASGLTRAFAVHARTLEQLDARGIADELIATGTPLARLRLFGSAEVDLSGLPSRFPFVLITPQYHVERLLLERATGLGAQIVRGAEVTGLRQQDDLVHVDLLGPGGRVTTTAASYVVGADGHHSTVREAVGLDFPGESVVRSLVLADVRMTEPPIDVLTVAGNGHGFCFVVPYGDGWYRVITRDPKVDLPDDAPATLDEVASTARQVLGTDYGMHSERWISRFHSEERQARRYRVGRVFLAGDAAHVHSPAGGMGMNTGLQDATNLGWKLATAVLGHGDGLLDSYQAERHPVGEMVLRTSGGLVRGALLRSATARAARNLVVRGVLAVPPVRDRVVGRLSGIGIRYDGHGVTHAGERAPDVIGSDGRRLAEALRDGRFVLVLPDPMGPVQPGDHLAVLPVASAGWMLVRPDGYLAAAGASRAGLDAAVALPTRAGVHAR